MIRIYRDTDKQSLLDTVKIIRQTAGVISSTLTGLLDGVESSIKADKLAQAAKFAKQFSVFCSSESKIRHTKYLSAALDRVWN